MNAPPVQYEARKTWRVGTLVYDQRALVNVFFWMLWGDFCLNLMDSGVAPNLALVQLKKYGASATTIGLLTGTAVELMSMIGVAVISTASDRHRGWLGRRMPFMLWATPPLAIFLAAMGFAPHWASAVQRAAPGLLGGLSAGAVTIAVFAFFYLGYRLFDLFPQSVYYYLWTDVIPHELMGTFACLFRVFATAGTLLFNYFLLEHVEDNPGLICLLAAGLYLVTFLLLCFMVKEGQYPPPEPPPPGRWTERAARSIGRYVRESYSLAFYWKYYLFTFCFMCGFRPFSNFLLLYGKDTLKIDLGTYGRIMSVRDGVQIGVFFLLGPIVDRFHPLRAGLVGFLLILLAALGSILFIHGTWSFAIWVIITFVCVAIYQGATAALGPRLLPREAYGQFCSATAFFWHLGLMVLMPVLGAIIDHFGNGAVFVWFLGFSVVGIVMMYLMYLDWKRLGGDENYQPPLVREPAPAFEVVLPGEAV